MIDGCMSVSIRTLLGIRGPPAMRCDNLRNKYWDVSGEDYSRDDKRTTCLPSMD